jgi:hypothetical protein
VRVLGAGLSLSLVLSGCASVKDPGITDPGVICTMIAVSSLNVTVRDTATGQRVCDAAVVAIQGGDRYELDRTGDPQGCGYAGPYERAGVFEVRATRPGYQAASVGNVRVGADECHVIPVSLTVDLRPGS